jgi:hypothetical protein
VRIAGSLQVGETARRAQELKLPRRGRASGQLGAESQSIDDIENMLKR